MASVFENQEKDVLKVLLDKKKGVIAKEFEKVCPTDASAHRMLKELHNIFDDMYEEIKAIK
jgi:F420-dependent methylenetetrahydromethanopterin dehydrogenase